MQAMAVRIMAVHAELLSVVLGPKVHLLRGALPSSVTLDATRLLRMWDYQGHLSSTVRTFF
jgi:hypothetical protein